MTSTDLMRRHRPVNMILCVAIAVVAGWLVLLFAAEPVPHHGFDLDRQEFKVLRYSQAG